MSAVMKKMVYVLLLYVLFLSPSFSQVDSLESFFPLQIGNFWQYEVTHIFDSDTSIYYEYTIVLSDTVIGPQNKTYYLVEVPFYGYPSSDTIKLLRFDNELKSIVQRSWWSEDTTTLFKLDAALNECWLYFGWPEICCWSIGNLNIFGENKSFKRYVQPGIASWSYDLAEDFGPVEMIDNQSYVVTNVFKYNLVYAKINGVEYGILPVYDNINSVKNFKLSQNYPNPFNPSTTIAYQIPGTEFITLKVYDILGREVATLVNEEKPAGSYETQFEGSGLTSGIYFYQLNTGNYAETKKMFLLK